VAEVRGELEAVVFDAGGTLVRLDFEWIAAALGEQSISTDVAALRRAEVEGRRRYDGSRRDHAVPGMPLGGPGDTRAYYGGMLEAVGVPSERIAETIERLHTRERGAGLWTRPVEGARATLDAVIGMGLRCAVVSNSDGRAEWHLEHSGVRAGIEFVVDSQRVGVEKPDPRIFHIALERLAIPAARALYVGDILSVDEVGSRAAGMPFVLIDPWGDYATGGTPSVRSIAELPAWIAGTYRVPRTPIARSTTQGG
jgi:putative hydrolase of the HAD superfamily